MTIGNRQSDPFNYPSLMSRVLERENLQLALTHVIRNKGGAGIDGMTVHELPPYLAAHRLEIKQALLDGSYKPKPVKRVEIPKPDGRKRKLGIPTVLDRFIQQAIAQVLQPIWEPHFHINSYGFRPYKSAHQAIYYAQMRIQQGKSWVVDLDLDAFFDRVNHDRLMHKLKEHCKDKELLRLINQYLKTPIQTNESKEKPREGVPQGSPLSPLLSNIVLNELDWELEKRGRTFARYADDLQIYVSGQKAGERVKASIQDFIERTLRLKVNAGKSAVSRPWERTFLGFTFSPKTPHKIKVADKALSKLKDKVRELSRRTRGLNIVKIIADLKRSLLGWKAYFDIAEVLSPLRDIDKWIRRKLRCYLWKQWGRSGYRQLRSRGVDRQLAWNTAKSAKDPWRISGSKALYFALPNRYFRHMGLPEISNRAANEE